MRRARAVFHYLTTTEDDEDDLNQETDDHSKDGNLEWLNPVKDCQSQCDDSEDENEYAHGLFRLRSGLF